MLSRNSKPLSLAAAFALAVAMGVVACGAQVSALNHACPCETGWTCCPNDNICVPPGAACSHPLDGAPNQCPAGIRLADKGLVTIGPDGSAEPFPDSIAMSGEVLGTLPNDGTKVAFDYSQSAWLEDGGMTLRGWIVIGGGAQTYRVGVWAEDGTTRLPLSLSAYGPIELGPSEGDCFATLVGGGAVAADNGMFAPPQWGRYFVTAYHAINVGQDGTLSIQAEGDTQYASAYVSIEPPGD